MSDLNKFNWGYNRGASRNTGPDPARGARMGSLKGSPYRPLDLVAKWMILGSTLGLILVAIVDAGFAAFPIVLVAAPCALGLGIMIARMGGKLWARIAGVFYAAVMVGLAAAFLAQDRWV